MKPRPSLLFIPDISGFTKFMSEADPNFSSEIIPALLNKIIYTNKIGLKVSEIEGDAIFFYKMGELPELSMLIEQCKLFYIGFYQKIRDFEIENNHVESENLRTKLGLKVILHYGPNVGSVQIGNRIKLMGEDVITAHKLLKNDINLYEYLLISEDLLDNYDTDNLNESIAWAQFKNGSSNYEHIGNINYKYVDLQPLLEK